VFVISGDRPSWSLVSVEYCSVREVISSQVVVGYVRTELHSLLDTCADLTYTSNRLRRLVTRQFSVVYIRSILQQYGSSFIITQRCVKPSARSSGFDTTRRSFLCGKETKKRYNHFWPHFATNGRRSQREREREREEESGAIQLHA